MGWVFAPFRALTRVWDEEPSRLRPRRCGRRAVPVNELKNCNSVQQKLHFFVISLANMQDIPYNG